jgi:hypothetical protein
MPHFIFGHDYEEAAISQFYSAGGFLLYLLLPHFNKKETGKNRYLSKRRDEGTFNY